MMKLSETWKQNKLVLSVVLIVIMAIGSLIWTKNTDNSAYTDNKSAVEVVKLHLDDLKNNFGVVSFSVNSVKEVYNEQHLKNILGDEDAVKMGLKKENIALIDAYINVQYDGTKVPNSSGENKYIGFTLIRENESKPWLIANSGQGMGGVSLIDFQNPRPAERAELYVWKNRELTGNDNTYFTVLDGANGNEQESKIYDLAAASDSIDRVNLTLTETPNLTDLAIYQLNTTDFTKQEILEIADKIIINADNHVISIGVWEERKK